MTDRPATREPAQPNLEQALNLPRIAIESTEPTLDEGRFAAKATIGHPVNVRTRIFTDGHDQLAAAVCWRQKGEETWRRARLKPVGNDWWEGSFTPTQVALHEFRIEAWWDLYETFRQELSKKYGAGVPVGLEAEEGRRHVEHAVKRAQGETRAVLEDAMNRIHHSHLIEEKISVLLSPEIAAAMEAADPHEHCSYSATYPLDVDRTRALFASWYELFPRSETDSPERHGTFADVIRRLPAIRDMGFDVLYFPPIHPIGRKHRKGRNNSLEAGPNDPGSPYAIGSEEGGHDAIHPELGSFEDFRTLVEAAAEHGLEIALDFAIQCSPDHPWLKEHPGWFAWRPDGSIKYAENPPKKYQDIVNVDFYAEESKPALWEALRDVVWLWVQNGVKMFRVDNPHTKPLPFWEWLIADIRARDPDVLFLAEAFTRPAMMARLGKVGFNQSYTYFTWRNTKQEMAEYLTELNRAPLRDCYRPNFFVNTPDINPFFLQTSGRPGFLIRAALATMGSGLWGMYSGFELCEGAPVPGKEEYLDSEKYEIRPRNYHAYGNIVWEIAQLNRIRRQNPALQTHLGFQEYACFNDNILYFGKRTADLSNFILIAVSMDPINAQEAHFELPLWEFGLPDSAQTYGEDLMNGHRWTWYGKTQFMRIEPWQLPFGIWRITPPGRDPDLPVGQ